MNEFKSYAEAHCAERPCELPDYPVMEKKANPHDFSVRENMLELEQVSDKTSALLDCVGHLVFDADTNEAVGDTTVFCMKEGSMLNLYKARSIYARLEEIAKGLGV